MPARPACLPCRWLSSPRSPFFIWLQLRADSLPEEELLYAHNVPHIADLKTAVQTLKPSVLIGLNSPQPLESGEVPTGQSISFSEDACKEMAANHRRPVIFALSYPDRVRIPCHVPMLCCCC